MRSSCLPTNGSACSGPKVIFFNHLAFFRFKKSVIFVCVSVKFFYFFEGSFGGAGRKKKGRETLVLILARIFFI